MVFVTDNQTPEVLERCKKPFDFPSALISSEFSSMLGARSLPIAAMRRNHFNAAFLLKLLIEFVAVVSLVANKLVRGIARKTAVYRFSDQFHLVGRSAFNVSGDRKTRSVCDGHDLGALAALCLADSKTPFFAGTKLPSMKASRMSILPRSFRSSTNSWAMRLKMPCLTHCWNRLWHVWYGGYRSGRSFQGAPVRNIQRIPLSTDLGSRAGRPLGSFGGVISLMIGSIRLHCSFVRSILIILHNQDVMSRFNYLF